MIQWTKDLFKSKEEKQNDAIKKYCLGLFRQEIEDEGINIPIDFYDKVMCTIIQPLPYEYEVRCRYNFNDGKSAMKPYCYYCIKKQIDYENYSKK